MEDAKNRIKHTGIVESLGPQCVKVWITQSSACSACKIAGHCNASETKVKVVEAFDREPTRFSVGQEVTVWAESHVATVALLLGFGGPFVVMTGVLVLVLAITHDEGMAALAGLGALVPYYLLLWLMRHRIARRIQFHVDANI